MNRKEIVAYLKENDLLNEVSSTYAKNYTNCSNNDLLTIVNSHKNNCNKKSGVYNKLDRNEIVKKIKENNLQDKIKEKFGKNYTVLKTEDLAYFVYNNINKKALCTDTVNDKKDKTVNKTDKIINVLKKICHVLNLKEYINELD